MRRKMHILSLRRIGKKDDVEEDENEDKNEDQKENLDGVILGGWQERRHEG